MNPINSIESALEALDHEDEGVRYQAAWWLGKHRAAEAVPKLIQCLDDERDRTATGGYPLRRQAARSLGMIKDSTCTAELIRMLDTEDVQLHEATLRALIEIKDERCIDSLITYLNKKIESKPIEALIEALTEYQVCDALEKVKPYLKSDSERITSSAASFFFRCTGDNNYLSTIVSLLEHSNRFVRQSAAFDLARLSDITTARPIIDANIPNNIKMFTIKSILKSSLNNQKNIETKSSNNHDHEEINKDLFKQLDQLTRENFSGNLLIEKNTVKDDLKSHQFGANSFKSIPDTFSKLRSPSLSEREIGIEQLIDFSAGRESDVLDLYFSEPDQDIKMGLIKAMSKLKKATFLPALFDAIGVEIGNHCQGNIRRVAACSLGEIDWRDCTDSQSMSQTIKKLDWTLKYPDDWGLRYSACLSLESIHTKAASELLHSAHNNESDVVVRTRIARALASTNMHGYCSKSPNDDDVRPHQS